MKHHLLLNRVSAFNRRGGFCSGDAYYIQDGYGPFGFRRPTSAPADAFFVRRNPWEIVRFTLADTAILRSQRDNRTAELPMWAIKMHEAAGLAA